MDAYKLHLILNYYPAIGFVIGTLMMVGGYWRRSDGLKRMALKLFLGLAVFTFPVSATGEIAGANGAYSGMTAEGLVQHKNFARTAFLLIEATGIAAIVGLVMMRRGAGAARTGTLITLVLSVISCGVVLTTVYLGRQIKWAAAPAVQAIR